MQCPKDEWVKSQACNITISVKWLLRRKQKRLSIKTMFVTLSQQKYIFSIYNWFEYSTIMLQSNIILKAGSPMDVFTQMANVTGSIQFLVIQISWVSNPLLISLWPSS